MGPKAPTEGMADARRAAPEGATHASQGSRVLRGWVGATQRAWRTRCCARTRVNGVEGNELANYVAQEATGVTPRSISGKTRM